MTYDVHIDEMSKVSNSAIFLGSAYVGAFTSVGFQGFQHPNASASFFRSDEGRSPTVIGDNARILSNCIICCGTKIGSNFRADSHTYIGEQCIVGNDVVIEYGGRIYNDCVIGNGTTVGGFVCNDVVIGEGCVVQGSLVHARREEGVEASPRIGSRCLVGTNSTIVGGISMADGSILAAGSVLLINTEPNALYAGNPAKRIKSATWY